MDRRCIKCPARCCTYFAVPIGRPETYEDFEQVRWYLLHRGVAVYVDTEGEWNMLVRNLCRNLKKVPGGKEPGSHFRCKDYGNRPIICREFSPRTCEFTRGSHAVEEFFETAGQLDDYARRMLGDWVFDGERAKVTGKKPPKKPRPKPKSRRET